MKKSPRKLIFAIAAVLLLIIGGIVYLILKTSADFRGLANKSASVRVAAGGATSGEPRAVASSTARETLTFNFKDPKIVEPIEDNRSSSYSFFFNRQTIGVLLLSPSGGSGPESFEKWSAGIKDTLALDGENVPVTHQKIGGREAMAFETGQDAAKSWNVLTEVDGRVLWLQSRTDQAVLAKFLENLSGLK